MRHLRHGGDHEFFSAQVPYFSSPGRSAGGPRLGLEPEPHGRTDLLGRPGARCVRAGPGLSRPPGLMGSSDRSLTCGGLARLPERPRFDRFPADRPGYPPANRNSHDAGGRRLGFPGPTAVHGVSDVHRSARIVRGSVVDFDRSESHHLDATGHDGSSVRGRRDPGGSGSRPRGPATGPRDDPRRPFDGRDGRRHSTPRDGALDGRFELRIRQRGAILS